MLLFGTIGVAPRAHGSGWHAYDRPWTRDAAINSWNALSFIWPDLAEETLTAVLTDDQQTGLRIGGQYWDAIIWAQAAQAVSDDR